MDNKIKTKTRLAAIQLVSQQLVINQDIETIKDDFDKHYRNTQLDNTSEKIEYNVNFLSKLVNYFKTIDIKNFSEEINQLIKFDRKFDVVFCSHVIEHQRNVGLFLDKIFDILSDDGVLIISAPKEDHNLIEGHLNSFIFPLFLQQMIHAGFDCKDGKFLSTIENSFIVSKADNFDMSERLENGYQWTEKHQNRSPIELKTSSVDMLFHNCQHFQPNLTLKLPKNYWSYGMIINMERWNLKFNT